VFETCFLALREGHRLQVLEDRVLRRTSGTKWRMEETHSSQNIIAAII
jgi:hypothetical protein